MRRYPYADFLKIVASMAVIVNHAFGICTPYNVTSPYFAGMSVINAFSHFSVPVFMMVSGGLVLGGNSNVKTSLRRAVRCVMSIILWTLVYTVDGMCPRSGRLADAALHLWYLYTAAWLYAVSPVLDIFSVHAPQHTLRYVIILGAATAPVLLCAACLSPAAAVIVKKMHISHTFAFIWCWLFGYYALRHNVFRLALPLGAAGAVITAAGTLFLSYRAGAPDYRLFSFSSANILMFAAGVFCGAKLLFDKITPPEWVLTLICRLGRATGTAYMIHMLILGRLIRILPPWNAFARAAALSAAVWLASIGAGLIADEIRLISARKKSACQRNFHL